MPDQNEKKSPPFSKLSETEKKLAVIAYYRDEYKPKPTPEELKLFEDRVLQNKEDPAVKKAYDDTIAKLDKVYNIKPATAYTEEVVNLNIFTPGKTKTVTRYRHADGSRASEKDTIDHHVLDRQKRDNAEFLAFDKKGNVLEDHFKLAMEVVGQINAREAHLRRQKFIPDGVEVKVLAEMEALEIAEEKKLRDAELPVVPPEITTAVAKKIATDKSRPPEERMVGLVILDEFDRWKGSYDAAAAAWQVKGRTLPPKLGVDATDWAELYKRAKPYLEDPEGYSPGTKMYGGSFDSKENQEIFASIMAAKTLQQKNPAAAQEFTEKQLAKQKDKFEESLLDSAYKRAGINLRDALATDADGKFTSSDFKINIPDGTSIDFKKISTLIGANPDLNSDKKLDRAEIAAVKDGMERIITLTTDPAVKESATQFKHAMQELGDEKRTPPSAMTNGRER